MADERKPEDAPEGFWDEMGKWLMSDPTRQQKVLKLFAEKDDAPAPEPNDGPQNDPPAKTKKGWFSSE